MSYIEKLQQISDLKDAIAQHGVIPAALLNKINYKLRLEWNYTSNSMEGNSLTKRETRTVMVDAIDVNGKPLKDIQEMKNHDKVISTIMRMGKGELNISENRIKEIHTGIMYEENPEDQKYIGQWKNVDNYMYNNEGERFDFVPHSQVKQQMHELVNWTNDEKEKIVRAQKSAIHPVSLALKFHLDYLNIHPFYDGNGRTARIFTNLILISYGYPPLYIKESEKKNYYRYLTDIQSYGGDTNLFYDFMAGLLIRSLQITLDTLEGKEIEEEDDIDKEIALFKASLDKTTERKKTKSWENISYIIEEFGIPLFQKFIDKLSQFDDLFHSHEHRIIFNTEQSPIYDLQLRSGGNGLSTAMFPESLKNWLHLPHNLYKNLTSFGIEYFFKGYKHSKPFDLPVFLRFTFEEYEYSVTLMIENNSGDFYFLTNSYDQTIDGSTISNIVNDLTKGVFKAIKD